MKKRRNKNQRQKQSTTTTMESDVSPMNDIEEQLKRQRMKKQSKDMNIDTEDTKDDSISTILSVNADCTTMGDYTYDRKRKKYFPTKYIVSQSKLDDDIINDPNSINNSKTTQLRTIYKCFQSPVLQYQSQILHGSIRRHRLLGDWCSTMIRDSMVLQRMTPNKKSIRHVHLSSNHTITEPDNNNNTFFSILGGSAPWAQSLVVIPTNNNQRKHRYPKIFSVPPCESYHHGKLLHQQRSVNSNSKYIIGCIQSTENVSIFSRCDSSGNNNISMSYWDIALNDCVTLPAYPDWIEFGGHHGLQCQLHYDDCEIQQHPHYKKKITSDVLCIEADFTNSHPHIALYGLRNGQVMIRDFRMKTNCIVNVPNNNNNSPIDSVIRIQTLFRHRPNQFVVRGINSWSLFDLRQMNETKRNDTTKRHSAIIHQNIIFNNIDTSPTNRTYMVGKGMAIDPLQSTIMVPFWNRTTNNACVRLWSLESGNYIGAKYISSIDQQQQQQQTDQRCYSYDIELCSTLTDAWTFNKNKNNTKSYVINRKHGSFGLWLKIGQDDVHHIICDGRFEV